LSDGLHHEPKALRGKQQTSLAPQLPTPASLYSMKLKRR
jgi:hypothetical protein